MLSWQGSRTEAARKPKETLFLKKGHARKTGLDFSPPKSGPSGGFGFRLSAEPKMPGASEPCTRQVANPRAPGRFFGSVFLAGRHFLLLV